MYQKTVLNNGLRVITNFMPERQSVALGVWIKVGGRYETRENKGIAHFLEHLVFKGSQKFSSRKIKESIEGVGGHLNGFTSEELTCYLVKLPAKHLNLSLDVLCDMALRPRLLKKDVEKERGVIIEEIKMYKDLPQAYVHELLDELLWPNHPLGMNLAGTVESVGRISPAHMSDFQKKFYHPANMVIAGCGLLRHQDLVRRIEKILPHLPAKKIEFCTAQNNQKMPGLNFFSKPTEQTHLAIGFLGLKREDPRRHILGLLNVILGANMSSRLFNEVREKRGLAYEIGTQVKRLEDTGAFVIHAGIDNRKVVKTVEVVLKELKRIKKELPKSNEVSRAKEFYTGQLRLALEDTLDHMLWIGEATTALDKTYTLQDILKEVEKIKPQDISALSSFIFKDKKFNLALIGPDLEKNKKEIEGLIPIL